MILAMFERRRGWRCFATLIISAVVAAIVFVSYLCPDKMCSLRYSNPSLSTEPQVMQADSRKTLEFDAEILSKDYTDFDGEDEDVIVFLHIQKTGGTTFGKHLVRDLDENPCTCVRGRKKCDCFTKKHSHIWLFSRFSTGWACGLHADWTELKNCVGETLDHKENDRRARRYRYLHVQDCSAIFLCFLDF